jgi:hypothetical protein
MNARMHPWDHDQQENEHRTGVSSSRCPRSAVPRFPSREARWRTLVN